MLFDSRPVLLPTSIESDLVFDRVEDLKTNLLSMMIGVLYV